MASFRETAKTSGRRRVTERIPYTGTTVDSIAVQVGAILKAEEEAQRIVLDATKNYILVEKFVKGQPEAEQEQEAYDMALRSNQMIEYVPEKKISPAEQMLDIFRMITDEELDVSHVLIGNFVTFSNWVKVSRRRPKIFGVDVMVVKQIPDDAFIVCGSEWKDAKPEDIRLSIKGVIL